MTLSFDKHAFSRHLTDPSVYVCMYMSLGQEREREREVCSKGEKLEGMYIGRLMKLMNMFFHSQPFPGSGIILNSTSSGRTANRADRSWRR